MILDGDHVIIINRVKKILSDPIFQYKTLPDKEDYRQLVLNWLSMLSEQGLGKISYPVAQGGEYDMGKYAAVFDTLGYHDLSLAIKFGVQFGLFGGSILGLGTHHHHEKYLPQVGNLDLLGCFAMTETGHGSNVRDLETTAIFDPSTKEIIINSPSPFSQKEYIGNALHGKLATVFAQLNCRRSESRDPRYPCSFAR